MERNEMIEVLVEKAKVSREEAEAALENCDWDLLDSIIYLERKEKTEKKNEKTIIEVDIKENRENNEQKKGHNKNSQEHFGGVGEVVGRIFRFIGKIIKRGNENYFEVRKDNEKPIRVSLTISILLLVFLTVPSVILLVLGLFCGYKYSIYGPSMNYDGVNNIFEEVSKSAETVKKDFKEGYEK